MKKYLTSEDIYDLAYEKLGVSNIKVDKEQELAELLDLEYDEKADEYLNPDYKPMKIKEIYKFGTNYYGGLQLCSNNGKFHARIENYNSNPDYFKDDEWHEIPKSLYDKLIQFEKS